METPVATCTAAVPRKLPALTLQPGDVVEVDGREWELVERSPMSERVCQPPLELWYVVAVYDELDADGDDEDLADAVVPAKVHPADLIRYTLAEVP